MQYIQLVINRKFLHTMLYKIEGSIIKQYLKFYHTITQEIQKESEVQEMDVMLAMSYDAKATLAMQYIGVGETINEKISILCKNYSKSALINMWINLVKGNKEVVL